MELSRLATKLQSSLTLEITAKAKKLKEEGIDVISFGAGEPDFNTPKYIIDEAKKAMDIGFTKYTSTSGISPLKKEIIKKFKNDNDLEYTEKQIIVSTGAKQCLSNVFQTIINPGDEVLISKPCWISYPELVTLYGGSPILVDCAEENEFKFDIDSLKKNLSDKTKAIVITSPNNPTGSVYNYDELKTIADFAKDNDLFIISDEIYEKLIYDGEKHISVASISEDAYNRTIVINGLSKTFAMTGWRLGYAAGNEKVIKVMSNIQSHTTSNANSITQYAAVKALAAAGNEIEAMVKEFDARRKYMVDRINNMKTISCVKPKGAFYVMINVSDLYSDKIKDSFMLSKILLDEAKIAVIPGAAFGDDRYIRLSYATSMENIKNGLDRLENFINNMK